MQYRKDKYGNPISVLGYGCMRFPQTMGKIHLEDARKLILEAIDQGINYFDTAYIYPGSEAALGTVLEEAGLRDKVYIATKLPYYLIKSMDTLEKIFAEQLKRLRTDHIDFYLMHMLNDTQTWQRLKDMGIESWLEEKMRIGAIRQVGFSYHGNSRMFCSLVDAYPWDFCQIQYNYMDEHTQAGRTGLHYAHEKGLPVFIMEPLRGGRLVTLLPDEAKRLFSQCTNPGTPAAWALRWLWDQEEVTCVLSGMKTMEVLRENVETADKSCPGMLGQSERDMLASVAKAINEKMKVGCTGCGYCMPCPKNVDIPGTFAAYNRLHTDGKFTGLKEYFMCTALRKDSTAASNCVGCGKCEKHCPQGIPIRKELENARGELEGTLYRTAAKIAKWLKTF